jgi:hypothetical protein
MNNFQRSFRILILYYYLTFTLTGIPHTVILLRILCAEKDFLKESCTLRGQC